MRNVFIEMCTIEIVGELSVYDGPVASVGIGNLGYQSDFRILDMVGLISPEVSKQKGTKRLLLLPDNQTNESGWPMFQDLEIRPGHQASNSDWILSQSPDVIFVNLDRASLPCQIEMLNHPDFADNYVSCGEYFVRQDLVKPGQSLASLEY